MGHLNGILARVGGNLNNHFQKSQMPEGLPGGGMLKLRFDRYIILNRLQIEDSTFSSVILKHFVKPPTSNSSLELSCLINCKSSSVDIFDTPGNRIFTASVVNFIAILDFALIVCGVLGIRRKIRSVQSLSL